MPRLNVVEPKHAAGEVADLYEDIENEMGTVINIFKGLGNSATALRAYRILAATLEKGSLSEQDREVIYLTASEMNDCRYCVAAHTQVARDTGFAENEVIAIRKGEPADPKLATLAQFTRNVMQSKGFVKDSEIEDMRHAGYGDAELAEVPGMIALATFSNYFNHIHGTELDFPEAPKI